MDEIHRILGNLGLNKREIEIYLSLIKSHSKTALEISKETKIDRTTIYDILNKMMHEGIVSNMKKNNSTYFKAISIDNLTAYFKEKINALESISEKLKEMENKGKNEFDCEVFIGLDGLKTVFRDLLDSGQNYKLIGVKKKYEEILSYFNDQGIIKVKENKIKEEVITLIGEKFIKIPKGSYHYLKGGLNSEVTTLFYGETVLFLIWKEPYFAIRIKNREFIKSQEEYFNLILKLTKNSQT